MSLKACLPLVLNGNLVSKDGSLDTKIIMHGENHSNIDNSYYEKLLSKGALGKILVEHSRDSSDIKPEDEPLFKEHAKGSEWIFYTLTMAKNENLMCFDTRSEHGYLNAFQELAVFAAAERLETGNLDDIRIFIEGVRTNMQVFYTREDFFNVFPGYVQRSGKYLNSQLKAVGALLKLNKTHGKEFLIFGIPLKDLLRGVALTLASNIRKVASVSVDITLINTVVLLHLQGERQLNIFTGKNHVVRLSKLLELKNLKLKGMTADLEDSADLELDGDLAMDQRIIDFSN